MKMKKLKENHRDTEYTEETTLRRPCRRRGYTEKSSVLSVPLWLKAF